MGDASDVGDVSHVGDVGDGDDGANGTPSGDDILPEAVPQHAACKALDFAVFLSQTNPSRK